jgi:hypothetical protein
MVYLALPAEEEIMAAWDFLDVMWDEGMGMNEGFLCTGPTSHPSSREQGPNHTMLTLSVLLPEFLPTLDGLTTVPEWKIATHSRRQCENIFVTGKWKM